MIRNKVTGPAPLALMPEVPPGDSPEPTGLLAAPLPRENPPRVWKADWGVPNGFHDRWR